MAVLHVISCESIGKKSGCKILLYNVCARNVVSNVRLILYSVQRKTLTCVRWCAV